MTFLNRFSRVSRAALLLLVFFTIDKIVAIVRQVLTARVFGLSAELDAFNAANNLPDLLFALISGGALAIAFIPVLSEVITNKGGTEAWKLFSRIANLAFLVTALLGIFMVIFADQLVGWRLGIAPGFHTDQQRLVAELMRLNLVATLLFSISGLVMAGLQANQHFLFPAIAPILYNIGQIFGAAILAPETPMQIGPIQLPAFGLGIHGLVYGVILGALLHLLIQVPGLIRYKFVWVGELGLKTEDVRKVLRLLGPRLLTMLFIQLIFIARDNMASGLGTGAVSALTYGWMLMQVPETLIGTALGTALLPTLAEHAARQDWDSFWQAIQRSTRYLIALNIPVAVILSIGLGPLVSLAFGFDAGGTDLVMLAMTGYLAGLLSHSLIEVGARAFYSRQNAKIPLLASAVTGVAFVLFGILLTRTSGAPGIAWATSIAFTIEMVFLFYLLIRSVGRKLEFGKALLRSLAAAVLAGVLTWFLPQVLLFPAWGSAILAMTIAFAAAAVVVFRDVKTIVTI
jgi:putative peptidoglycan lipid II flippase